MSSDDTSQQHQQTPLSFGPPTEPATESVLVESPHIGLDAETVSAAEISVTVGALPLTASAGGLDQKISQPLTPPGYDLCRRLGGGGMGDVFLAREHTSERSVAIKFLRSPGNPTAVERFLAEVRALARLDHPHIVKVYATDFYRHQPFFTMEYVEGGTLSENVSKDGPFDCIRAASLIATIARAVQVAHSTRVLHRDLKPNNILLRHNGDPVITDFGLAKLIDRDDGITNATGALGTPSYMPPEQVSRKYGEIGPQADVYGLGATLYHLLTGRPPFTGESPAQITVRVERDSPTRPRSIRADLPLELEAIVLRCLEKSPISRYSSSGKLADDLDRYLRGQAPIAPLLTTRRQVIRTLHGWRWPIAVGLLLFAVVGAAFMLMGPRDVVKQIEREWQEKGEVVLIADKGKPRWYNWQLGAADLGFSQTGEGSCSYEVSGYSLLELNPRPPSDRYLLRAKIRFAQSKLGADDTLGTSAGVYFGHAVLSAAGGEIVHYLFGVTFDDSPRAPAPGSGVRPLGAAQLRVATLLQRPERSTNGPTSGIRSVAFNRAVSFPGPWRPIELAITPEGVKASWEKNGSMVEFAAISAQELQINLEEAQAKVAAELGPNHGLVVPSWSPRMAFGIWNYRASIDVKEVTASNLP